MNKYLMYAFFHMKGDAVRLNGRLLALSPAISRAEAVKLRTADKDKAKEEQKDKRNLHLLREGRKWRTIFVAIFWLCLIWFLVAGDSDSAFAFM